MLILRHYDVCHIQLPQLIVLAYKKANLLEKTFSVKFGYKKIVSLIEFIEDQGKLFQVFKNFHHEEVSLSFTCERIPNGTRMFI